jgi:NTE family protein
MTLKAQEFFQSVESIVDTLHAKGLHQRIYSDVIDGNGHQYVDLVMEGGGVLGIALLGYIYILEQAGLRFVGLGGASAGSITALALAAIDEPQNEKSTKLVDIVANMPMASFVDGKGDDDDDASDFIDTMLKRPGLTRGLWKGMQIIDNLSEILGLNRGERFHDWLKKDVLDPNGVSTTAALRARMARTPEGWRLRSDSPHRISQLDGNDNLPPLDPRKDYLCVVAADISTETKVEFPRMASLYWADVDTVHPADYARCSMSIPIFFKPFSLSMSVRDDEHRTLWCDMAGFNEHSVKRDFLPSKCLFVDGGVLSNFPIDVFHNTRKVPTRPTFGVKLQWDDRKHEVNKVFDVVTQSFNSARHCLDYEFIRKNPDFNQLVSYIDTAKHDWLNFNLSDEHKLDLFTLGALSAVDFLERFDWARYKDTRVKLVEAHQEAGRPQLLKS